jgi:hypothetical protein
MKDFRQATVIRYEDVVPLVEALKFYADAENWIPLKGIGVSNVQIDAGEKADHALRNQPQVRIATAEIER